MKYAGVLFIHTSAPSDIQLGLLLQEHQQRRKCIFCVKFTGAMIDEITTRRFFRKINVQLYDNHILIHKIGPLESSEYELTYEMIENRKSIEIKTSFGLLTISLLIFIIGLLCLLGSYSDVSPLFFAITAFFIIVALLTKSRTVIVKSYDARNIEFYFTRRNKDDVIRFSETLIKTADKYLYRKYSKVDRDLPVEGQIEKLLFLKERNLLSDEEFERLKIQLLGRSNKNNIGYSYGS